MIFHLSFRDKKTLYSYYLKIFVFFILSLLFTYGLLVYNNPVPIDSPSFLPVVQRRIDTIIAISIASVCHSVATISFQTVVNNKIVTPSLLGFGALYSTIQTATLYFFGLTALINFTGNYAFIFQVIIMVVFCLLLYYWLLANNNSNIQLLLLVGIVLGSGLNPYHLSCQD